jgi:hypothetical protein
MHGLLEYFHPGPFVVGFFAQFAIGLVKLFLDRRGNRVKNRGNDE